MKSIICRALAAAIFDDPEAVRYTPLTSQARFESLATVTSTFFRAPPPGPCRRDTDLGITFAGTMFYDGQGFMVREEDGISSALELSGAAVCIELGTTTELNAADYFAANGMDLSNAVIFVNRDEVDPGLSRRPLRRLHH